jgi:RNA polymerase sigma-70 factor (ECF subfamily)
MVDAVAMAAERAARIAYGRLLASVSKAFRDVAAAEDALSEAFLRALETWPVVGVPERPEAWLIAVARNRLTDGARRARVRIDAEPTLRAAMDEAMPPAATIPDHRLALMFACTHPAIDPSVRTPLMLQTVLGLDAARIASAFLVPPATMGQRLVRAKARIREAAARFEIPETDDLAERAEAVREAVYAAYGLGWEAGTDDATGARTLTREAIWLAEVLVEVLPDDPEARGLLALVLFLEGRAAARRDAAGAYVPLDRQDCRLWDDGLIGRAERELSRAARTRRPGRFQIEAAIQSAHTVAVRTGRDLSAAILLLHERLFETAPTLGNAIGVAAARLATGDAGGALADLEGLPAERTAAYQPWHAVRAHALERAGRPREASAAFRTAAGLSLDPAVRDHLVARARNLAPGSG